MYKCEKWVEFRMTSDNSLLQDWFVHLMLDQNVMIKTKTQLILVNLIVFVVPVKIKCF